MRSATPLGERTFEIAGEAGIDSRADVASLAVKRGWGLLELRTLSMSLEDIFLELTTEESVPEIGSDAKPDATEEG